MRKHRLLAFVGLNDTSTTSVGANVHNNQSKTDRAGSVVGRLGCGAGRLGLWPGRLGVVQRFGYPHAGGGVYGFCGCRHGRILDRQSLRLDGWWRSRVTVVPMVRVSAEDRYSSGSNTNTFPLAERSTARSTAVPPRTW